MVVFLVLVHASLRSPAKGGGYARVDGGEEVVGIDETNFIVCFQDVEVGVPPMPPPVLPINPDESGTI